MAVPGHRPGLGRGPRLPPLDAKIHGPLGIWALPYQKSHFYFFLVCSPSLQARTDDLAPGLRAGVRPWSSLHGPGQGMGRWVLAPAAV